MHQVTAAIAHVWLLLYRPGPLLLPAFDYYLRRTAEYWAGVVLLRTRGCPVNADGSEHA